MVTDRERQIIRCVVHDNWQEAIELAKQWGWFRPEAARAKADCERVLDAFDLAIPWTDPAIEESER